MIWYYTLDMSKFHQKTCRNDEQTQQDGRIQNQLHKWMPFLYTTNKNTEKIVEHNHPIHNSPKENKLARNKPNHGGEVSLQWKVYIFEERDGKRH